MLSDKVQKLELENKRLATIIADITKLDVPKPKYCEQCKHYMQHYGRDEYGIFFMLYTGHCTCGVPAGKRKGKSSPAPEDTCLCFEEKIYKGSGQYGKQQSIITRSSERIRHVTAGSKGTYEA